MLAVRLERATKGKAERAQKDWPHSLCSSFSQTEMLNLPGFVRSTSRTVCPSCLQAHQDETRDHSLISSFVSFVMVERRASSSPCVLASLVLAAPLRLWTTEQYLSSQVRRACRRESWRFLIGSPLRARAGIVV
jgi:hypothetical protein